MSWLDYWFGREYMFNDLGPEVSRDDHCIKITFKIPGVSKDKIKVEQFDDRILIGVEDKNFYRYRLNHESYDYGEATAELSLGVLTVEIPISKKIGRLVEIKAD